ncbi:MAG: sigma 54-interacting transcriptional regulator [Steroidobacteraceae bacterium]
MTTISSKPTVKSRRRAHKPDIATSIRSRILKMHDLADRLHFSPNEGLIWLDDRRMILLHSEAFGTLRRELVDSLGANTARGLLTRVGYLAGARDAELAWKTYGERSELDFMAAGAQLHALEGIVAVEPIRTEIDSSRGHCYAEFIWHRSFEAETHVRNHGIGSEPACWMEVGYSSGYLSTHMGKRILVRELECVATGHPHCRALGLPVEEWDDPEIELSYLQPQPASVPLKAAVFAPVTTSTAQPHSEPNQNENMVGASAAYTSVLHRLRRVAATNATVLLLGESGVGKSVFAREVHRQSRRRDQPFVEVNCAAIPESLMESELFGVERGAYSGAVAARPGRFEICNGGTLFLDEIATLSPTAQGKLLRVLQTGELERLGSTKTVKVDVRVIAATNENLQQAVAQQRFREDLFYRLNVFPITIAPLRERREDLPVLLEFLLARFSRMHDRRLPGITPRALQALHSHNWPGNIRELENVIERGVILADDGESLDMRHLFSVDSPATTAEAQSLVEPGANISIAGAAEPDRSDASRIDVWAEQVLCNGAVQLAEVEAALVRKAMQRAGGNISRAAGILGITRAQLDYRVKKLPG